MNTYYEKMDSVEKQKERRSIESELESKLELNKTIDFVIHDESDIPSNFEKKARNARSITTGTFAFR